MSIKAVNYHPPFEADKFYHVYNHSVGSDNFFNSNANYEYFLTKFKLYVLPVVSVHAYVLMPNHFHFLIQVKPQQELYKHYYEKEVKLNSLKIKEVKDFEAEKFVSKQFSIFFNSYSKAYNKVYDRMGSLFVNKFKRLIIDTDEYYENCVLYIHQNPIHHKFTNLITDWKYSTYREITNGDNDSINYKNVIHQFGDLENFISVHQNINQNLITSFNE